MGRFATRRATSIALSCFRTIQDAAFDSFATFRGATHVPQIFSAGVRSTAAPVSKTSDGYIEPELVELKAKFRGQSGTKSSVKFREQGRIPGILFSLPNNTSKLIHMDRDELVRKIKENGASGFLSRPLMLTIEKKKTGSESYRVLPKLIHERPWSPNMYIENVTFMHCPRDRILKVPVPIKIIGKDNAPGSKKGGFVMMLRRLLDLKCTADRIPPYVEVDVSELDLKDVIFAHQVNLPKGSEFIRMEPTTAICKMATQKGG